MNKRFMLVACAGITILVLRIYANDSSKNPVSIPPAPAQPVEDHVPFTSPEPNAIKEPTPSVKSAPAVPASAAPTPPIPAPVAKPTQLTVTPPVNNHTSANNTPVTSKGASVPNAPSMPPAMNFQMQMAQIHQKVFSGFEQADLLEFGQALEQALNGALASREFDAGINKLEDAVKDLATSFGKNIEVDRALHVKVKQAFDTAVSEFETLNRSGKISNLTGEAYLARVLKSALSGLKIGFAKAQVIPDNTPVQANLSLKDQSGSHSAPMPATPNTPKANPMPTNLTTKAPNVPEPTPTPVPAPVSPTKS